MLRQKQMSKFVDGKQNRQVTVSQNVAQNNLVVLLGKVLVEQGFGLFVLKKFKRNGSIALAVHQYVGLSERLFQNGSIIQKGLDIGSHGALGVDRIPLVAPLFRTRRVMDRKRKSIRTETDG